jgi:hypothetical protein
MTYTFKENIDRENLLNDLIDEFPKYKIITKSNKVIVVQKSDAIGADLIIDKNVLSVHGGFPTDGAQLLFVICLLFLGIIIPLVIYATAIQPDQAKLAKEVDAFIIKRSKK